MRAELALDALEMAIWMRRRQSLSGLVHHSDRGVQLLSIRYTERLAGEGVIASVGSKGDSYDNALAETLNGLFKTELIRRRGPWRSVDDVELATLTWVDWYNNRCLHSACGHVPPTEFEINYHQHRGGARCRLNPNPEVSIKPRAVHQQRSGNPNFSEYEAAGRLERPAAILAASGRTGARQIPRLTRSP